MSETITLTAMPTPNPNTVKFLVNKTFFEVGSIDFSEAKKAKNSTLPKALFEVDGIEGVMIGTNFVSITKQDDMGWEKVLEPASELIKDLCAKKDLELFDPTLLESISSASADDSDIVKKIKSILDSEIRPAIAMDGGDCEFCGYEDGILTIRMQGACSNCPSSVMTLKMGIENRIREEVPELKEVVQV